MSIKKHFLSSPILFIGEQLIYINQLIINDYLLLHGVYCFLKLVLKDRRKDATL